MKCCVPICKSVQGKTKTLSFFEFPSNLECRESWIKAIAGIRHNSLWMPSDRSLVCEKHFGEKDFSISTKRRILLPYAVPSIFRNNPLPKLKEWETKQRKTLASRLPKKPDKNKRVRKRNEERSQDSLDAKESRKSRKLNPMPRRFARAKYDERGLDKETGLDLCDCLEESCPGCWMDCPSCGSRKCGHECRCLRRYKYEYTELEGYNVSVKPKTK